jgi:UDP-2-acetamido-2-deoxy-ribo-hexuluronate aminotransferase
MEKIPFIDLQTQYQAYRAEIDLAIHKVLESSQYIMGPEVTELEKNLEKFTGVKHAISCSSGNDALLLALMAIDVKQGDEVIVPAFTFFSTAEVVAFLGAKPVFVDIEEENYNIDFSKIEEKITKNTKAIIPVSLYGQPPDFDEINAIAKKYNIYVIEDAAQSFGSEYKGKKSCNLSDIACTSFFPSKPLGCYGDGGAIFTNNDEIAKKLKSLRVHGQSKRYHHKYIGINGRLDTIQAAVLNVKLKFFDVEIRKRIELGKQYKSSLKGSSLFLPKVKNNRTHIFGQFTVRSEKRKEITEKLNAEGIPTAIHYPIPLHKQEAFEYLKITEKFPVAEKVAKEVFSLPFSPFLNQKDFEKIITILSERLKE